jgi:hypothetical protein
MSFPCGPHLRVSHYGDPRIDRYILAERRHRGKMWREHLPGMASLLPPQVPIPCLYAKLLD